MTDGNRLSDGDGLYEREPNVIGTTTDMADLTQADKLRYGEESYICTHGVYTG